MKNLIKKTLGAAGVALCAFAALPSFGETITVASGGASGDVLSIVPCDADGNETVYTNDTYNAESPYGVGQAFYVRVRLWNHRIAYGDTPTAEDCEYMRWMRCYTDWEKYESVSESVMASDLVDHPITLRMFTGDSSSPAEASLVKIVASDNTEYTDLIFEYDTQPGDFALPIKLATWNGAGTDAVAEGFNGQGTMFYIYSDMFTFRPLDRRNGTNIIEEVHWIIDTPKQEGDDLGDFPVAKDAIANRDTAWGGSVNAAPQNFSSTDLGFYVQTVDFSNTWETEPTDDSAGNWYTVAEGDVDPSPVLTALERPTVTTTVYLWTTNESSVVVTNLSSLANAGVTLFRKEMFTGWDGSAEISNTYWVASVPVNTTNDLNFALYGVARDTSAELFLSSWPGFNRASATATIVQDYIKVPVSVGEPKPTSLSITGPDSITATGDRFAVSTTKISVSVSQAATNNISIVLVPEIDGDTDSESWTNYVFFADSASVTQTDPPPSRGANYLTLTISKDATQSNEIYVYGLGSNKGTTTLRLTPKFVASDGTYTTDDPYGFVVYNDAILTTTLSSTLSASGEPEFDTTPIMNVAAGLTVGVTGAYRDLRGDSDSTFKLEVRPAASSTAQVITRDGLVFSATNSTLNAGTLVYRADDNTETLPEITFTSEAQSNSSYRVTANLSGATTGWITFTHDVVDQSVKGGVLDSDGNLTTSATAAEGDTISVTVTKPEYYGAMDGDSFWVFLVATNETSGAVDSNWFTNCTCIVGTNNVESTPGRGVQIDALDTSVTFTITAATAMPSGVDFKVVIVKNSDGFYRADDTFTDFPSTDFYLTVTNTSATASGMWMYMEQDDDSDAVDKDSSGTGAFSETVMRGKSRAFRVRVTDSDYDKINGMVVKWSVLNAEGKEQSFTNSVGTKVKYIRVTTTPDSTIDDSENWFVYTFNAATNYTIQAEVWDAYDYPGLAYEEDEDKRGSIITKTVTVTGSSTVDIAASFTNADGDNVLSEDETSSQTVTVTLGEWTDEADIMVKLVVGPHNPSETNPGFIEFEEQAAETIGKTNIYYHTFRAGAYSAWELDVVLDTLDGCASSASATRGFDFAAEVVWTNDTAEAELESKEMVPTEFYVSGSLKKPLKLVNVAPTIDASMPSTYAAEDIINSFTNLAQDVEIPWVLPTDCEADLNATNWNTAAVKSGSTLGYTNGLMMVVRGSGIQTEYYSTYGQSNGTIVPSFTSASGASTMYIDFYDKDGLVGTAGPYIYPQKITKLLRTTSTWPMGGNASIQLSSKYAAASGAGYGHTWVSNGDKRFNSAESFFLTWDCGTENDIIVYAFGYKAGATDNGNLNTLTENGVTTKRDVWLSPAGNHALNAQVTSDTTYYTNPEELYDSFFYGWILASEPGGTEYSVTVDPEISSNTNMAKTATIPLPTEADESSGYVTTYAEAIFSMEYSRYDNMGDINNDGVPDYYATLAWEDGAQLATVDGEGGELGTVGSANDDGDTYPAASHLGASAVGSVRQNSTQAFTAKAEIRGYHEGLNFGMFKVNNAEYTRYGWISELHLSTNEKKALLREIFARRDYLMNQVYTSKLVTNASKDEVKELGLVTNILAHIYLKDGANATGDNMFWYPNFLSTDGETVTVASGYTLTENVDKDEIDESTGTNMVVSATAWIQSYTPVDADEAVVITNYVDDIMATIYTNTYDDTFHVANVFDSYGLDKVDYDLWLDYHSDDGNPLFSEQQASVKAYIDYTWRHYRTAGTWGFTIENRTDPTSEDTDGDGMDDGFEYFMWYNAIVGTGEEPMTGCRFNLEDIESYDDVITADEIASIYNPNIYRTWTMQDTDKDGLYDLEEFLLDTSPVHWDSDRDGLSDLFEIMYGMDAASASNGQNGSMNADGDAMAVWQADATDPLGIYNYIYERSDGTYWALDTACENYISTNKSEMAVTNVIGFQVVPFNGTWILPTEDTADYVTTHTNVFEEFVFKPSFGYKTAFVTLYHHQVHNYFGFDPRTGWAVESNGSLSTTSRWIENGAVLAGGTPIKTGTYTAKDEYLLLKYRYIVGLRSYSDDKSNLGANDTTLQNIFAAGTTNPNGDVDEVTVTWGDTTTTYSAVPHGADTDEDGVPDGWELYVGVNPNIDFTIGRSDPKHDTLYWDGTAIWPINMADGSEYSDGLSLLGEFAGTDSCGHYSDCKSIYANHPSQSDGAAYNWFNKFFPTDPRNKDTDGDGITDGAERGNGWEGTFTLNRWGQTVTTTAKFYATYGSPSDGGSRSIAGGGMNPLTIDTDEDGLPDPWERQYIGLLFQGANVATDVAISSDIYDDVRGLVQAWWADTNDTSSTYHILGGMDPTVNDAATPVITGAADLDWDADGLQNWQEYMVQAMRHLRYDDPWTPLLGRDCPKFDMESGKYIEGQFNGENGFMRTSYLQPFTEQDTNTLAEAGYPHFAEIIGQHPDYLSILGYFADPPMEWDHARIDLGNKYMLPPLPVRDMVYTAGYKMPLTDDNGTRIWLLGEWEEEVDLGVLGTSNVTVQVTYTGEVYYVSNGTDYTTQALITETDEDTGETTSFYAYVEPMYTVVTQKMAYTLVPDRTQYPDLLYVGSDPRLWDTDLDGMDDYYELYHGLNPILGSLGSTSGTTFRDIIGYNYILGGATAMLNCWCNAWSGWDNDIMPAYDPIKFPWTMGVEECDADGDGLRNYEESIIVNVTSPGSPHTDPTPLWMTDSTVPMMDPVSTIDRSITTNFVYGMNGSVVMELVKGKWVRKIQSVVTNDTVMAVCPCFGSPSYTALYYPNEFVSDVFTRYETNDWGVVTEYQSYLNIKKAWNCYTYDYITSFEQNEGYDSDDDWRTDSGEIKSLSRKNSDPIDYTDPTRRQSIWFGGKDAPGAAISYQPVYRSYNGTDLFRQFTVEAWIRPDEVANGSDQYIVARASRYGQWDLETALDYQGNSNAVIRMCFALGIDSEGRAFAEIQNTTELSSRVIGDELEDGEWVHLAATYDGAQLKLYRNGKLEETASTTIQPANGVTVIIQNPQGIVDFPYDMYHIVPSTTIIGARPIGDGAFYQESAAGAQNWNAIATDFYAGRVAEVRTWDGARTASEIAKYYKTTFTPDDLKEMRQEVFTAWAGGSRRNDNDANDVLPAELIQYYTMSTLPGATDKSYIRTEPTGFATNVLGYARNPDTNEDLGDMLKIGWWNAFQTNGVVANAAYTSAHVVPWIENMVSHLPRMCGSFEDSVFWSEDYAGWTPATYQGLSAFDIVNTMNPYSLSVRYFEDEYLLNKLANMYYHETGATASVGSNSTAASLTGASGKFWKYMWDYRLGFAGTLDLVPIGSAYALRCEDYWDGSGAETVWQETGADANANDLPDWWEEYAKSAYGTSGDLTPDTEIYRKGLLMTAYEAYIRDLAAGMLPTKSIDATYANVDDVNSNSLPDWWEEIYGVTGGAADDDDNDGLSNYNEYLLSEYFDLGVTFNPVKANSVSKYDPDYFFKIGQLYAGEIFTDHDMMEDLWEDEQGTSYGSRYAWDAKLDNDEDGWSNFGECRYSQMTSGILAKNVSHTLGDTELKDMPIPTLRLTLRYNGDQPLSSSTGTTSDSSDENTLAPLVIQTFTKTGYVVPDATFNVQPGATVAGIRYIGMWADRTVRGTLAPGYVNSSSIDIEFMGVNKNDTYSWYLWDENLTTEMLMTGTYEQYISYMNTYGIYGFTYYNSSAGTTSLGRVQFITSDGSWSGTDGNIAITVDDSTENGYITYGGERCGTINLITGDYSLDLGYFDRTTLASTNGAGSVTLKTSSIRVVYSSTTPKLESHKLNLYLGEANTGYVKEGENMIVAFYDVDGDGKYTVGEPFGCTLADVGWNSATAEIELTDTTPIITRCDLEQATTDRNALYGTESGDSYAVTAGELSGGRYERVRLVRTAVDGVSISENNIANRVIFDKNINLDQRSYVYEGDVLDDDVFDLDWDYFSEITAKVSDPQTVTYRMVLGNGDVSIDGTNNLYTIATNRRFDANGSRCRPTIESPGPQQSAVFGSRPTFKWSMKFTNDGKEHQSNTYTAFRIQVRDGSTVVYDTGIRRAPARDLEGVYSFVPDVYAGDILEPSKNYTWRVSMYNSKFQSDYWSADDNNTFRMNPLENSLGTIKVCVKYFGPSNVIGNGTVRVEAFTTPDFSGTPVARTSITNSTDIATIKAVDTEHETNATLIGLSEGTYYVRAYIDMTTTSSYTYGYERVKDDWESWGYVCQRSGETADIFMPATIVIAETDAQDEPFDLYIEDVDTNGNCLPDAWEMRNNGGSLDNGTENINDSVAGIFINQSISSNLQNKATGSLVTSGLSAYVYSVLGNAGVAALVLDADTETHSSYLLAAQAAVGTLTTVTTPNDVTVTAIAADEDTVTLTITGSADVVTTSTSGTKSLLGVGSTLYNSEETTDTTGKLVGVVQYRTSLTEGDWADTTTSVEITVDSENKVFTTEPFAVAKPAGATQCFYRIQLKN